MAEADGTARRPRLDDVAAAVGVSPATVSLVLRGVAGPSAGTRERVLAAAARLGYRPDRAASVLASRRSRSIGVVTLLDSRCEALLLLGPEAPADQLTDLGRRLPVVVVGRPVPPVGVDVVRAAD